MITTLKDRIESVVKYYDGNQSKAAQEVGVSRGVIADILSGRKKSLHASSLGKFYSAGWNINWIATGNEEPRLEDMPHRNQDGPGGITGTIIHAFELLDRIAAQTDASIINELPPDIELRLSQLLTKILEDRYKKTE